MDEGKVKHGHTDFKLLKFFIAARFKLIFVAVEMFYGIITITFGVARGTTSDWHPWMRWSWLELA